MTEHTERDSNKATKTAQPKTMQKVYSKPPDRALALNELLKDKISYPVDEIVRFFTHLFPEGFLDDEYLACFADGLVYHTYPITTEQLILRLNNSDTALRLFFGTSTLQIDPTLGVLRNRRSSFGRLQLLVLDDIGTKIPFEKIPEAFKPTYIIETSPGNHQYGYTIEPPIEDYDQASALIHFAYSLGFSDAGGKTVMKKVRLPGSVNGKLSRDYAGFQSKLKELNDVDYSPEQICEILDFPLNWEGICENPRAAMQKGPLESTRVFVDGLHSEIATPQVDVVAEFLAVETPPEIYNVSNGWLTVQCPNWQSHTEQVFGQTDVAYYSPLGCGETDRQRQSRHFHCFHDSCKGLTTHDLLEDVVAMGGPEAPVFDPVSELAGRCVFDVSSGQVHDITRTPILSYPKMSVFADDHAQLVKIFTHQTPSGEGRWAYKTQAELYKRHPGRVSVNGSVVEPRIASRIYPVAGNGLVLNRFSRPDYGMGDIDMHHVEMFLDFISYLMPNEFERDIFLQWLAAKVQDQAFRGWGMLNITPTEGTGRGTLTRIISALLGEHNCLTVKADQLFNASDNFNEHQQKTMLFVGETHVVSRHQYEATHDRLKELIDTTPHRTVLNNKYGTKQEINIYTSYLMAGNHRGLQYVGDGDRRIFTIRNPVVKRPQSYYVKLNRWIDTVTSDGVSAFVPHLGRYLLRQTPDLEFLNGDAPMTEFKKEVLDESRSGPGTVCQAIIHCWPDRLITQRQFEYLISQVYLAKVGEVCTPGFMRKLFSECTLKTRIEIRMRVPVSPTTRTQGRMRLINKDLDNEITERLLTDTKDLTPNQKAQLQRVQEGIDLVMIVERIKNMLSLDC